MERQNTLILDATGDGIYGLDREGRATFINPAGAAMLHGRRQRSSARPCTTSTTTREPTALRIPGRMPGLCDLTDGAVRCVADEVFWKADGTSFPVEYVSTPMRDEAGA